LLLHLMVLVLHLLLPLFAVESSVAPYCAHRSDDYSSSSRFVSSAQQTNNTILNYLEIVLLFLMF